MKVKTWNKVFLVSVVFSASYTVVSIVPPTIWIGLFIGLLSMLVNLAFLLYTQRLISRGRGEEIRP